MTYQNIPIEVWFIELFDGTLSEEAKHEFLAFCIVNNIEVPYNLTTLKPSESVLHTKDFLRFPTHESILNDPKQDLLISFKEGLLNTTGAQWVEQQIESNSTWKIMHDEITATYLVPEAQEFLEKSRLYKTQSSRWMLYTSVAAASLIGLLWFIFPFTSNHKEGLTHAVKKLEKRKPTNLINTAEKGQLISNYRKTRIKDQSTPAIIEGIYFSSSKDCILHPETYNELETKSLLSQTKSENDSLGSLTNDNTEIASPVYKSKNLRSWIKERLIERIFDREDNALVLERETKWFNQSIVIKYKQHEDRSISQVKLGPFVFEWNKIGRAHV